MGEAKLGSQNIGKIFLGSQQLGGGLTFPKDRLENVMDNNSIILYINTNNHPVNFILDDVLEETVDANSVWFINTSRNHFLNMVTTENVYIHIFSDTVILPMTYMIAGNPIPVDLDSDDGVMIIISAQ